MHFAFKVRGLLLKLENGIVLFLYQSLHVGDTFGEFRVFTLQPVPLQSIALQLGTQLDQASTLLVVVVILELVEQDCCLLCLRSGYIESVLGPAVLCPHVEVLLFEVGLIVGHILNDLVELLCFGLANVDAL